MPCGAGPARDSLQHAQWRRAVSAPRLVDLAYDAEVPLRPSSIVLEEPAVSRAIASVLPGETVRGFRLLHGGRANTNYAVETANRTVVLRLFTRAGRARDKELALYRWLREVPVPQVLGGTECAGIPAAVLQCMPGVTLATAAVGFDDQQWSTAGHSIGVALSKIHAREFDRHGDLQGRGRHLVVEPWPFGTGVADFIEHCLAHTPAGSRLGVERCAALRSQLARAREGLRPDVRTPSLTHGDFNASNLLVDSHGRLTAVLDWEFAHAGDPLMDLGNLLRDDPERNPRWPPRFVDALCAQLQLPADWRQRARTIDLSSALEFLSRPAAGAGTQARAIRQIEQFLADGKQL